MINSNVYVLIPGEKLTPDVSNHMTRKDFNWIVTGVGPRKGMTFKGFPSIPYFLSLMGATWAHLSVRLMYILKN